MQRRRRRKLDVFGRRVKSGWRLRGQKLLKRQDDGKKKTTTNGGCDAKREEDVGRQRIRLPRVIKGRSGSIALIAGVRETGRETSQRVH
jgi:hypothetical protein